MYAKCSEGKNLEELDDEKMLASAVAFLAVGQEHEQEASATLLAFTVKVYDSGSTWWVGNELQQGINIHLSGPRTAYEIICDVNNPIRETIRHAFDAI